MSAIFGVYYLDGKPVSPQLLAEMSKSLAHRGADDSGVWHEGAVGLGHRFLRTTPEAQYEKFPFASQDNSLCLTADVRLDNRGELIDCFGLRGDRDESKITDSELILSAYRKWGEDCAKHLLGDFAFAIWDARERKLVCVRDHFGVRPFYYYSSEKLFAFATEIKALLLVPEVPKRINETMFVNYLESSIEDRETTFYLDVFRLQPGHQISVNRESKKSSAYWNYTLPEELKLNSDEEYAEALREQFATAVRSRLRSSVPVGTMLSGGLDSSSITCMAKKLLADDPSKRLHTFSAVFDTVKECDERPYMNAVVRENGIKPHFIVADDHGPFVDMDEIVQFYDEPVYGGNTYLSWLSYKTAKANGVGVILDGFDGDNTISHGIGYFPELVNQKQWLKLGLELAALSKKRELSPYEVVWSWYWSRGINPWIKKSRFRSRVRNSFRRIKAGVNTNGKNGKESATNGIQKTSDILNEDFARRILPAMRKKPANPEPATERESHLSNLNSNGSPFSLELLDRISGALSLEVRFPFWDKRLIEFCLSLPAEQKIKKGWTRLVMRRAMNGILPPEIQWRPGKTDMTPSVKYGLLKYGRKYMDEVIINNPSAIADYVNVKILREAYKRFLNSEASDIDLLAIQRSVSLALWLQKVG